MIRTLALCTLLLALSATPSGTPDDPERPAFREAPPGAWEDLVGGRAAALPLAAKRGGASQPAEVRTAIVADMVAAVLSRRGDISHMGTTVASRTYLALPCRKPNNTHCGLLVKLCGPAACRIMRQTDYGPSQKVHPDRIADVHPDTFTELCGVPAWVGVCEGGSWTTVAEIPLPETSTKEEAP